MIDSLSRASRVGNFIYPSSLLPKFVRNLLVYSRDGGATIVNVSILAGKMRSIKLKTICRIYKRSKKPKFSGVALKIRRYKYFF